MRNERCTVAGVGRSVGRLKDESRQSIDISPVSYRFSLALVPIDNGRANAQLSACRPSPALNEEILYPLRVVTRSLRLTFPSFIPRSKNRSVDLSID